VPINLFIFFSPGTPRLHCGVCGADLREIEVPTCRRGCQARRVVGRGALEQTRCGGLLSNQFIIPVPAQMRSAEETWYRGTADAIYQNINLIEDLVRVR